MLRTNANTESQTVAIKNRVRLIVFAAVMLVSGWAPLGQTHARELQELQDSFLVNTKLCRRSDAGSASLAGSHYRGSFRVVDALDTRERGIGGDAFSFEHVVDRLSAHGEILGDALHVFAGRVAEDDLFFLSFGERVHCSASETLSIENVVNGSHCDSEKCRHFHCSFSFSKTNSNFGFFFGCEELDVVHVKDYDPIRTTCQGELMVIISVPYSQTYKSARSTDLLSRKVA